MINPRIAEHVDYIFNKYTYNCVNPTFIQKLCQLSDGVYLEKAFIVGADTECQHSFFYLYASLWNDFKNCALIKIGYFHRAINP